LISQHIHFQQFTKSLLEVGAPFSALGNWQLQNYLHVKSSEVGSQRTGRREFLTLARAQWGDTLSMVIIGKYLSNKGASRKSSVASPATTALNKVANILFFSAQA
jgi:hypothetical protein